MSLFPNVVRGFWRLFPLLFDHVSAFRKKVIARNRRLKKNKKNSKNERCAPLGSRNSLVYRTRTALRLFRASAIDRARPSPLTPPFSRAIKHFKPFRFFSPRHAKYNRSSFIYASAVGDSTRSRSAGRPAGWTGGRLMDINNTRIVAPINCDLSRARRLGGGPK